METRTITMPIDNPTAIAGRATRKEWIGLIVIALPCILYSMDLTVLNLALPSLSTELKPSSTELLWIVDIYGFMVAGSLVTMGTLGDRIGRRKLLMIGAAAFGMASVAAAFSNSSAMLITMRALLGIAGATVAPSTLSLIRNMFHDPAQRTFAIGVWATSYSVGGAIGPLLGGVMIEYYWWGSVFLVAVPVMVLLLILAPILLPEFRNPKAEKLDIGSALISLLAILAFIYSMKEFAYAGIHWQPVLALATSAILGYAFIRRQHKLTDPFIDLALFRGRAFNTSLAVYTIAAVVMFGSFLFIAQYLQLVIGLSPLKAGLLTIPSSLAFIVGSMFTPMTVKWNRPDLVIGTGFILTGIAFSLFLFLDSGGLPMLVLATVLYSIAICPAVILTTDLIVGSAPPERSGSAASLSETSAELGGALGIATLGSIGTVIYRNVMMNAELPGVPENALAQARETLGGAVAAAGELAANGKSLLLETAQRAFVQAFEMNALISVFICIAMAGVTYALLKKR